MEICLGENVGRMRAQTSRADENTRVMVVKIFGCGAAPFVVGTDDEEFIDLHLLFNIL